jgi:ribulose-phosphate 3-epimerase
MVSEPEHVIEDWMHLGVRRIIVHVESTSNIENIIRDVAAHVTRATDDALEVVSLGLAIGTTTPIEKIEPYIYDIDFVQCMGIAEIGKQGEPFDERVIGQIEKLKRLHPELIVSVDGGVSLETAPRLLEAGASRLVSGSAILGSDNPAYVIKKLRALSS